VRFLDDGRIEMDTNSLERTMRPIACLACLIETAKLHGVDPKSYLGDVLNTLVNLWPTSRLHELLPSAWSARDRTAALEQAAA
jgi:transposase